MRFYQETRYFIINNDFVFGDSEIINRPLSSVPRFVAPNKSLLSKILDTLVESLEDKTKT